ncbi:MAG: ATP-binding protein [Methanoregulaceae archaeon]
MIYFALLVSFCLVSALITYALGVYVYAKNTASAVNRLFLAALLAATYWGIGEFLLWQAHAYGEFLFWLKFSSFWILAIIFAIHFIFVFTARPFVSRIPPLLLAAILYVPSVVFALIEIFTDSIFAVYYEPGGMLVYYPVQGSPAYVAEFSFVIALLFLALYASLASWREAPPGKIRRQNRLVFIGLLTIIGFGSLSGVILPALGYHTPNLVFVGILIFSVVITYAILKYGLFTLSPQAVVLDILRTMPDGFILVDMDSRIIAANAVAASIFNTKEQEIAGKLVEDFLPGSVWATLRLDIGDRESIPDREIILDGQEHRVISIAGALVKDPAGESAGDVLIIRDITDRKNAEKALRVANEKISLLTRLTRHDISNLVTALRMNLDLLYGKNDRVPPDPSLTRSIELTDKITRHLQFSLEYQDIGVKQPAWQPLEGMLSRAIYDLHHEGVAITREIAGVGIFADPLAMKVFYNLLENALRHGGEHLTSIRISTEPSGNGDLLVIFEDNGIGVPEGEKEQIFSCGYGKHTGLGLAISREILAITGISLRETGTPGKGARFEICIPKSAWRRI